MRHGQYERARVGELLLALRKIAGAARGRVLEQDGRRDGDVEALGEPSHGNAHASRTGGAELFVDAGPLVAEHQRNARDVGEVPRHELASWMRGHELVARATD